MHHYMHAVRTCNHCTRSLHAIFGLCWLTDPKHTDHPSIPPVDQHLQGASESLV